MLNLTLANIIALFTTWGYIIILPIAVLEGPIVSVIAGFLSSLGVFHFWIAYLILMLADFLGDLLYYGIGYLGHGPYIQRFVNAIGATPERLARLKKGFHKHDFKILMLNKTQAAGAIVLYFSGLIRMPLSRFLWINVLGSIPKVGFFLAIGFYFGKSYATINNYLDYTGMITFMIPIVLLAAYWLFKRYSKKNILLEGQLNDFQRGIGLKK